MSVSCQEKYFTGAAFWTVIYYRFFTIVLSDLLTPYSKLVHCAGECTGRSFYLKYKLLVLMG